MCMESRGRLVWMLALFAAVGVAVPAGAATYYLAPDGDDAAEGSAEWPWATLEHACAVVGPGDTVMLAPGNYPGRLRPQHSGKVGAPIVFAAQSRRTALLTGLTDAESDYAVQLEGLSDIQLQGLVIRTKDPRGRWVRIDRCERVVLDDLRMEDTDNALGLHITASRDLHISTCELRLARKGSMARIENCERVLIEGCSFTRGGHDVLLLLPDRTNRNFVLRGNVFHPTTCRGPLVDSVDRILFEDNVITRIFDGGRCASSNTQFFASDSIFRFNRLYSNWGSYLLSVSTYRDTLDFHGVRIYHNVFEGNSAVAVRALRSNRWETA